MKGKIRDTIHEVAIREDLILRKIKGQGIFFMPERIFAFEVGKAIAKNSGEIFGTTDLDWQVEKTIDNIGPLDLLISLPAEKKEIVIEFKKYGHFDQSIKDIRKLGGLKKEGRDLIFCNLIYENLKYEIHPTKNVMLKNIESECEKEKLRIERLGDKSGNFEFFTTPSVHGFLHYCLLAIWEVL